LRQGNTAEIQRDSLNPLDWANDLLRRITGDAATDETQVQGEATERATQLSDQGTARSKDLQSRSDTQGTALQNEATNQSAQIDTQSETQGRGLQSQAGAEGNRLTSESSANSQAIQQAATGTSTRLQSDVGALDAETRSNLNAATGTTGTDVTAAHGEADSTDAQVRNQWTALETQGGTRVKAATAQTETLVHSKTSLIQEYQSPGAHDPERFQKRWAELQGQVNVAEHGESNVRQTEGAGEAINAQAGGIWSKITNRGQALVGKVSSLASRAWSALQTRWSALQSTAAKALADVRQRSSAAVARVRNLATAAWTRLQNLASRAWPLLRDVATRAWTGLKSRGSAAWLALQAAAAAAWMALQSLANSILASLGSKISGIISRINGAVGRIVQFLASAVSSLISRVRSVTDRALTFLSSHAMAAWDALRSVGARAWQGLKDTAERAWSGLKDFGTRAWTRLKDLGNRVSNGLKELGTRIWNGLQTFAKRAWDMLSSAWEWLKQKAQAAWNWVKKAWEALKLTALRAWDWIKRKARAALDWLKRKWAWFKAMLRRAIDWLKAKWRWLKSIVKITIRIPDITLVKQINFKPWKFVDLDSGRVPFIKGVVDTPAGPVELALFGRAQAEATVAGSICPCTLKNTTITLQPLISRYTGQTELHVPGKAEEKLVLTGTIGGSGNLAGAVGIAEGGLQGTGTALGFGSLVVSPRIVYDSGKISFSERFRLEFCLKGTMGLDAFARLVATTAAPPSSGGGGGGPTPILPPGPIPLGPSPTIRTIGGSPATAGPAGAKKPPEKILWEGRWHIGSISKQECWNIGAKFTLTFNNGVPELEAEFDAGRISAAEVFRHMIEGIKLDSSPGGVDILRDTTASGICKCVGDDKCGGGKRYQVCVRTQKDCKKAQKDVDDFCNNNGEMKQKCVRPKCYYRHTEATCPDDCDPGTITPLDLGPASPTGCTPSPPVPFPPGSAALNGPVTPSIPLKPNQYGLTFPEAVKPAISARCDGTQWFPVLTSLVGDYSEQVRLLPGQQEVTGPGGNTTQGNFCAQATELDALGFGPPQAIWYMITAVQAHEDVHLSRFRPALVAKATAIEATITSLSVPDSPGKTPAQAAAELTALPGFPAALARAKSVWLTEILIRVRNDHNPGGPCDQAEHRVVDPMVNGICKHAKANSWGPCPVCRI